MIGPVLGGAPRLRYLAATTTVTCDGNSITNGQGHTSNASKTYPAQLQAMAPINNQFTVTNLGISGQSLEAMAYYVDDVNATYVAGKKNILIAWEGTNARDVLNRTGAVMASQMAGYVADRLAAHPDWIIVLMTTLPFMRVGDTQEVRDVDNAQIDIFNNLMRANYKAWGAKGLVELRPPGSPFDMPNYLPASFETSALMALWASAESATGTHVHLGDAGMTYVANAVAAALRRLPAR